MGILVLISCREKGKASLAGRRCWKVRPKAKVKPMLMGPVVGETLSDKALGLVL